MRISRKTIWAAALPLSLAVHCEAGTPEPEPVVTVVVLNAARLPDRTLAEAEAVTSSIFRRAGVAMRWVDYAASEKEVGQVQEGVPAVQHRVYLKILPKSLTNRLRLKGTEYGLAVGNSRHAYILADRVKTLAVIGGLSEAHVLGYVIAHELGHLLLGPGSHAAGGIMSADLRVQVSLYAAQGHPPTFLPAQARQLLARLR